MDGGTVDQCIGITAEVRTLPTYGNSTWTYSILCNEVRIENSITLTSSAFYPIRILPDPHFTQSSFHSICIFPCTQPHVTESAIRILPYTRTKGLLLLHPRTVSVQFHSSKSKTRLFFANARFCRFPFSERST